MASDIYDDDYSQADMFDDDQVPYGPAPSIPAELAVPTTKTIVLLGNLTQEGVTSKVHSLGYRYEQRVLLSKAKNWLKIEAFLKQLEEQSHIIALLVHLYEPVLLYFGEPEYRQVWARMLSIIKKHPSLVFIYQDNLFGDFTVFETQQKWVEERVTFFELHDMPEAATEIKKRYELWKVQTEEAVKWAMQVIKEMEDAGVEIAPYKKNAEITIRIHDFLDEVDSGTFLRLYVPNGRYQADQFDRLLDIFENYLRTVEKKAFYVETRKTKHGVVYVFKSKEEIAVIRELDDAIARFEDFMKMCQRSSSDAEGVLVSMGVRPLDATALVSRYRVEYQRIIMDIMKERDVRLMTLKYELQSNVFELVNSSVLSSNQIQPATMLSVLSPAHVTYNVTNNIAAQTIIEQQINGDVTYGQEDRELIKLFFDHLDKINAERMKSALDELKDDAMPTETKQTAKQKIIGFLGKIAPTLTDGGIKLLIAYLEMKAKNPTP